MSGRRVNTAIDGVSEERPPRGFAVYGKVTDDRGNVTRVQRSSACGGPYCYVFTHDAEGRDHLTGIVGFPGGVATISPHLTREQARELAAALLRFADEGVAV